MNYTNAGYSEPQTAQAPSNPIPGALGMLGQTVHELGLTADNFVSRLNGVLVSLPPAVAAGSDRAALKEVSQSSPMADEITSLRRRVDNIRQQLQDALNRLEV